MRHFTVSWSLSFCPKPTAAQLDAVVAALGPIASVARPPEAGLLEREQGICAYVLVGAERELDSGRLALDVLTKAHCLGAGWSVLWPGLQGASSGAQPNLPSARPAEDWRRAARPEALDRLCGALDAVQPGSLGERAGLVYAGFEVTVLPVPAAPKTAPLPSAPPRASMPPPPIPATARPLAPDVAETFAKKVMPSLSDLFMQFRGVPWKWTRAEATRQLVALGAHFAEASDQTLAFALRSGIHGRVELDGDAVRWVDFILLDHAQPHLLDELALNGLRERFEALFEHAARFAAVLHGTPAFQGASGETGFPSEQWAEWAAVWPLPTARMMIQQKHDDRELPLELCLVFAPQR
jgi:hypothetical protein